VNGVVNLWVPYSMGGGGICSLAEDLNCTRMTLLRVVCHSVSNQPVVLCYVT